jgi:hypothetical protein
MEHADAFFEWLRTNGAYISPKVAIKDYSQEGARLGLVALDRIEVAE